MCFDWALTVARGQHSNFAIFLPVSGLPLSLLTPRLSPRSFVRMLYKRDSGAVTVYQFLVLPPPPLLHLPCASELLRSPRA
jgi:hypothetical protein